MMRSDLKDEEFYVYPATVTDGMMIADAFSGRPVILMASESRPTLFNAILGGLFQLVVFGIDLPISIVTDTLCLPYDIWSAKADKTEEVGKD